MVFGEEITDWIKGGYNESNHADNYLSVWNFTLTNVGDIFGNIMGHLWGTSWCTILILYHTIMELRRHSNNHVIKVWIEISTFWYIKTEWWIVVISSQKIIWIVDQTW